MGISSQRDAFGVPSLHQLCCNLILDVILNLENAPNVYNFAQTHNIRDLTQKAHAFLVHSWTGIAARHSLDYLREQIGVQLVDQLIEHQSESDELVARIKNVGQVVEPPPAKVSDKEEPAHRTTPGGKAIAKAGNSKIQSKFANSTIVTPKCHICNKSVYPFERIPGIDKVFHKECFRCNVCGCKLSSANYESSDEWAVFCKPHFKQHLLKHTKGSNATSAPSCMQTSSATVFNPTRCVRCGKSVYQTERAVATYRSRGEEYDLLFHTSCFRCKQCNCGPLRPGQWEVDSSSQDLLCKVHYMDRHREEREVNMVLVEKT